MRLAYSEAASDSMAAICAEVSQVFTGSRFRINPPTLAEESAPGSVVVQRARLFGCLVCERRQRAAILARLIFFRLRDIPRRILVMLQLMEDYAPVLAARTHIGTHARMHTIAGCPFSVFPW